MNISSSPRPMCLSPSGGSHQPDSSLVSISTDIQESVSSQSETIVASEPGNNQTGSSSASNISHDNHHHNNQHQATSTKKNLKTEYKSNFTPFDHYVYNEVTDSFVKPQNLTVSSPTGLGGSSQDLADGHMADIAIHGPSPVLNVGAYEPLNNGSGDLHASEPWYKEVARRHEKANEYRFKSEVGHNSPLSKATLLTDEDLIHHQTRSPCGNDPLTEAQIRDNQENSASASAKPSFRFTPHDYKRDHMIAHMANNNNFNLPKEHANESTAAGSASKTPTTAASSSSRRVQTATTSRPLTRSTAQSRARSQSSRRQPASATATRATQPQTASKSNHTTPTKKAPIRANPTTTSTTGRTPVTRTSVNSMASRTSSTRPTTTTNSNGVSRTGVSTTTSAPKRPATALRSTPSQKSAHSSTIGSLIIKSSSPANRASSNPATATTFTTSRLASSATRSPVKRAGPPASSTTGGRQAPIGRSAVSSTNRYVGSTGASRSLATSKASPSPSANTAVKSIKTPKALASAQEKAAAAAAAAVAVASVTAAAAATGAELGVSDTKGSIPVVDSSDDAEFAKIKSDIEAYDQQQQQLRDQQQILQPADATESHIPEELNLKHEHLITTQEPNYIFSNTEAGNMLADELAEAEVAANKAIKAEQQQLAEMEERQQPTYVTEQQTELISQAANDEIPMMIPVKDDILVAENNNDLMNSDHAQDRHAFDGDLVNGIAGGLISAEDRFDSSERDTSETHEQPQLQEHVSSESNNQGQNYDDEPYSIIPTTYGIPTEHSVDGEHNEDPRVDDARVDDVGHDDDNQEGVDEKIDNPTANEEVSTDINVTFRESESNAGLESESYVVQSDDNDVKLQHDASKDTMGEDIDAAPVRSDEILTTPRSIEIETEPEDVKTVTIDEAMTTSGKHMPILSDDTIQVNLGDETKALIDKEHDEVEHEKPLDLLGEDKHEQLDKQSKTSSQSDDDKPSELIEETVDESASLKDDPSPQQENTASAFPTNENGGNDLADFKSDHVDTTSGQEDTKRDESDHEWVDLEVEEQIGKANLLSEELQAGSPHNDDDDDDVKVDQTQIQPESHDQDDETEAHETHDWEKEVQTLSATNESPVTLVNEIPLTENKGVTRNEVDVGETFGFEEIKKSCESLDSIEQQQQVVDMSSDNTTDRSNAIVDTVDPTDDKQSTVDDYDVVADHTDDKDQDVGDGEDDNASDGGGKGEPFGNELLMNVADLVDIEAKKKEEMARKSELARQQSTTSSPIPPQFHDEMLLSADQLTEQFAQLAGESRQEDTKADGVIIENNSIESVDQEQQHQQLQHAERKQDLEARSSSEHNLVDDNKTSVSSSTSSSATLESSPKPVSSRVDDDETGPETVGDLIDNQDDTLANLITSPPSADIISASVVEQNEDNASHQVEVKESGKEDNDSNSNILDLSSSTETISKEVVDKQQQQQQPSHSGERSDQEGGAISSNTEGLQLQDSQNLFHISKQEDNEEEDDNNMNLAIAHSDSTIREMHSQSENLIQYDEMDNDEQLKLSNHLTNSDDELILDPRSAGARRSNSFGRYNEGAGLNTLMTQEDQVDADTATLSDGTTAEMVAPTVAENRVEVSTSKLTTAMPELSQTAAFVHQSRLTSDDDSDDDMLDLSRPGADPTDVAATMSPSSSVASELLRLQHQQQHQEYQAPRPNHDGDNNDDEDKKPAGNLSLDAPDADPKVTEITTTTTSTTPSDATVASEETKSEANPTGASSSS